MVPVIGVCGDYSVEEMMRFHVKWSPRSHSTVVGLLAVCELQWLEICRCVHADRGKMWNDLKL